MDDHIKTVDEKFGEIQLEIDAAREHLFAAQRLAHRYALDLRLLRSISNAVDYACDAYMLVGIARQDVINMIESKGI